MKKSKLFNFKKKKKISNFNFKLNIYQFRFKLKILVGFFNKILTILDALFTIH
jgi:hypothetical protein